MQTYLEFDPTSPNGYVERNGTPYRTSIALAYRKATGEVIYGRNTKENEKALKGGKFKLRIARYTDGTYRNRRLLCDSALGILMLENQAFTSEVTAAVDTGIRAYFTHVLSLGNCGPGKIALLKKMLFKDGKYIAGKSSFGRFPKETASKKSDGTSVVSLRAKFMSWLGELGGDDLSQTMSLYDIFIKCYCTFEDYELSQQFPGNAKPKHFETSKALSLHLGFREEWYDDTEKRGRKSRPLWKEFAEMSTTPGILPARLRPLPGQLKSLVRAGVTNGGMGKPRLSTARNRGIDMFMSEPDKLYSPYAAIINDQKLNFSASASGTTSTLLASAKSFAPAIFEDRELLKQYIMACVGYLVGGGMHTAHEVFTTANKAGLPYRPGQYIQMMPKSFANTQLYKRWLSEFWDVARWDEAQRYPGGPYGGVML